MRMTSIFRSTGMPACAGSAGRALWWRAPLSGVLLLAALAAVLPGPEPLLREACWSLLWTYPADLEVADDFEGFDNETGVSAPIVPNLVHFLRMGQPEFTFLEYLCVVAAYERQRPDAILFHTDLRDFDGDLWHRLQAAPGLREVLQIVPAHRPELVFGQPFHPVYGRWHVGDVMRIRILMKYGGIFLDNDSLLVQSLDTLRRFEMSLGWPQGAYMGTQVLVAHPDARFLRLWLESYRGAYVGRLWYYNAGQRPTKVALWPRPELVHREDRRLGVHMEVMEEVLVQRARPAWHADMLAVHLFERHTGLVRAEGAARSLAYPVTFTEDNICNYNVTLLDLARDLLPQLCSGDRP